MLYFEHHLDTRKVQWMESNAYSSDGETWLPSVTSILGIIDKGAQFHQWLQNVGRNADYITMRAMQDGKEVHDIIERFLSNPSNPISCATYDAQGKQVFCYSKEIWEMVIRFVQFYERFKPRLIAVEQPMADKELGYGGSLDLIVELNNYRYLIDIKTGSYLYDEYDLQLAAYGILWNKLFREYKIDKTAILHLDAKTRTEGKPGSIQGKGWQLVEIADEEKYNMDFLYFNNAFQLWKRRHPNWKPLFITLPDHICREEIDGRT